MQLADISRLEGLFNQTFFFRLEHDVVLPGVFRDGQPVTFRSRVESCCVLPVQAGNFKALEPALQFRLEGQAVPDFRVRAEHLAGATLADNSTASPGLYPARVPAYVADLSDCFTIAVLRAQAENPNLKQLMPFDVPWVLDVSKLGRPTPSESKSSAGVRQPDVRRLRAAIIHEGDRVNSGHYYLLAENAETTG